MEVLTIDKLTRYDHIAVPLQSHVHTAVLNLAWNRA